MRRRTWVEVVARGVRPEERELAAAGARRLERVVDVGQIVAEHGLVAIAMDQPQVLERGDAPEVPDQRAHQRGVDPLEVSVGDRRNQREGPLPGLGERVDGIRGRDAGHRWTRKLIRSIVASSVARLRRFPGSPWVWDLRFSGQRVA